MSRIKELSDDELNQKVSKLKTVNDLSLGNYGSIIVVLGKKNNWHTKSIVNCKVVIRRKDEIIIGTTLARRPILCKVPQKVLIDQENNKHYNSETKVLLCFGFSDKL